MRFNRSTFQITRTYHFLSYLFTPILLLLTGISAQAKDYYFSNSTGNDSYSSTQAQNPSTPWKSIAKLNSIFTGLSSGDNVYFNRGDVFYGTINIAKSGSSGKPITIGAYGSGAKPVITGFTTISGWTNEGNGIYSKVITSAALTNMVLINGSQYAMGRYPDAGYLTYESFVANLSIIDNNLASSPNWTGAEAVIKKNDWSLERCNITLHLGTTITYTTKASTQSGTAGYGYFIQNDLKTLTKYGEWYHNTSSGKFYMYFGSVDPNSVTVQVATLNNLLYNNGNYSNITADNISFSGAIDNIGYFNYSNTNCVVQNCDILFGGNCGLYFVGGDVGSVINNNRFYKCNNTGIICFGTSSVITNNNIGSMGTFEGQAFGTNGYSAIYVVGRGARVQYNNLHNTGWSGINLKYTGSAVIQYNFIDTTCALLDDGGGIYTTAINSSSRLIDHNIIRNTIGNSAGTTNPGDLSSGIFLDEVAENVTISNNTIFDNQYAGIKFHKANNNYIFDNTLYNNNVALQFEDWIGNNIRNNSLRRNILFASTKTQLCIQDLTVSNDIPLLGPADSNFYLRPMDDNNIIYLRSPATGYIYKTLSTWQSFTGLDAHTKKSPKTITDASQLNFQYNYSGSDKTIAFSGLSYVDAKGTVYNNSATIPAWSSLVLIANGTAAVLGKMPVANAGSAINTTLPVNSATLSGSGSDADGTIKSYQWIQISGPSTSSIVAATSSSTTVNNLIQGQYKFQLTVIDNSGSAGRDTVLVTVNPAAGVTLLPAVNPANTVNGLNYSYYEGKWSVLPEFSSLSPVTTGTVQNLDISSARSPTHFGFTFSGYVNVPADGQYTFSTSSDDGSNLFIDNILVVTNDGVHAITDASGTIGLKAGKHIISATYFQNTGGATFVVSYAGGGLSKQTIPASALYMESLLPAVNPANIVYGLDYNYYEGQWSVLPTFPSLTPLKQGTTSTFDISGASASTYYGYRFTGYVNVPADGQYTFYTSSDDGSKLYIDNLEIVDNDGLHGIAEASGTIGLKAGKHAITGTYFQYGGGETFVVSYSGGGLTKQVIPGSALYRLYTSSARSAVGNNAITMQNTLSVANVVAKALKISSYPNPSTTEFGLSVEGGTDEKIGISVMSADGKIMFQATGSSNKIYKLGSSFQPGLYIIKVIQGNSILTLKVIKG